MAKPPNGTFGDRVLKTGLVSEEQIDECLAIQEEFRKRGGRIPRLGELMAKKGYLTVDQVKSVLREQKKSAAAPKPVPEEDPEFQTGSMFGKFELLHRLGSGARGSAFKARNHDSDEIVTLHILHESYAQDRDYVKRFQKYTKQVVKLKHETIPRILSAGSAQKRLYYITEYVEGVTLRRLLEGRSKLDPQETLAIASGVCEALECSHALGIFHQSVNPSHILVTPDRQARLIGYGALPEPLREIEFQLHRKKEAPIYIAPEQVGDEGTATADARSDIYAVGAIIYHCLAGTPPFCGDDVDEVMLKVTEEGLIPLTLVMPDVPEALATLVHKMLAPEPEDRPQNAVRVVEELEQLRTEIMFESDAGALNVGPPSPPVRARTTGRMAPVAARAGTSGAMPATPNAAPASSGGGRRTKRAVGRGGRGTGRGSGKKDNTILYFVIGLICLAIAGGVAYVVVNHVRANKEREQRIKELQEKEFKEEQERVRKQALEHAQAVKDKQEKQRKEADERKKERMRIRAEEREAVLKEVKGETGKDIMDDDTPLTEEEMLARQKKLESEERKEKMRSKMGNINLETDPTQ